MINIKKVLLIGCGGAGGMIIPALACSFKQVTIADGDVYEDSNLSRQPYAVTGQNKAITVAKLFRSKYKGVKAHPHMITGTEDFGALDLIVSCVDNNAARAAAKEVANNHNCPLVVCQNDIRDAEAFLYLPNTDGMEIDPYERYGLSDLKEEVEDCEGVAKKPVEQTAFSNLVSAGNGMLIIQSLVHDSSQKNYLSEVRSTPHTVCKKIKQYL